MDAFVEVKTFTACKSQYDHNTADILPVDWNVHEVVLSDDHKFKKLDTIFAADDVGGGTGDVVGPLKQDSFDEK